MTQPAPYDLAVPSSAISSFGEAQTLFTEPVDYCIGAACLAKEPEHQCHGATYFLVGIRHNAALLVIAIPDREREAQLAFLCLVQLPALEAHAQKMQFGLRHGPLQAEQKSVVELRRVVAAVLVDHQRSG